MKRNIILLSALVISSVAYSQVGINNNAPQATLDITAKNTDATTAEGIIAPRLSGDEIKGKDLQYNAAQRGAIVYATSAVGSASTKTANITSEGYYYFDGALWTKFGSGTPTVNTEPWYNSAGNVQATSNTQNIYQMGKVAINKATTDKQLEVAGSFKTQYTDGTNYFGIENNNNDYGIGIPISMQYFANNANIAAATKYSLLQLRQDIAGIYSHDGSGESRMGLYAGNTGTISSFGSTNAAGNVESLIRGENRSDGLNNLILSHYKSSAEGTNITLEKLSGVNFNFLNSSNATEGNYTFPRNNGTANQVLTTNGATNAQLSWKDASTLAPEPWYIQNTTAGATANNQNIYQNGKVAVGFSSTDVVSTKQLEVKGDLKTKYSGTNFFSEVDTNNTDFGFPMLRTLVSDKADLSGYNSTLIITPGNAALGTSSFVSGSATGQINAASNSTTGFFGLTANNPAGTRNMSIRGTSTATQNDILLLSDTTSSYSTQVGISDQTGVTYNFTNSTGGVQGAYTFPRINGTANQVLTTDGATGAQLSWKDVSSLVTVPTEPWNVQGGTTAATTNAQNIYQAGNVSIGSQTPIAPFTSNSVTITPKLSVTGNVATTGSYYTTTGKYADYVFEDYFDGASKIDETYKFKSLEETAAYIKANKHLPGVTSIKDILKTDNGYTVNLSELSIQQLEKIEELYLHTIEQQQEIANQKTEINDLKSRMEKLEQLLVKENNNK